MGYDDLNQISQIMEMLTRAYNQQTLADLMATTLPAGVQMVFAPYELDTLVNQQNYIENMSHVNYFSYRIYLG